VVLDNNVVAGGVGWDGEAWRCFVQLAHRKLTDHNWTIEELVKRLSETI